ncbi:hypothetical protein G9A89_000307 [Geosiphon pyriformis]|nr:hypothetical protein G9A89_000307 [Geosiphon pyriformis]
MTSGCPPLLYLAITYLEYCAKAATKDDPPKDRRSKRVVTPYLPRYRLIQDGLNKDCAPSDMPTRLQLSVRLIHILAVVIYPFVYLRQVLNNEAFKGREDSVFALRCERSPTRTSLIEYSPGTCKLMKIVQHVDWRKEPIIAPKDSVFMSTSI